MQKYMDIDMVSSSDELAELEGDQYIEGLEARYFQYMNDLKVTDVSEEEGTFGSQYRIIFEDGMTGWIKKSRDTEYVIKYLKENGCKRKWITEVKSERGDKYYKIHLTDILYEVSGIRY